jgi:hypothetical protein
MGEAFTTQMGEVSLDDGRTPFGKEMLKHFLFDPKFKNLNQGIFPRSIASRRNIDISHQAPLDAFPVLSARSNRNIRKHAKLPLIHSSAMTIRNSSTSLEQR